LKNCIYLSLENHKKKKRCYLPFRDGKVLCQAVSDVGPASGGPAVEPPAYNAVRPLAFLLLVEMGKCQKSAPNRRSPASGPFGRLIMVPEIRSCMYELKRLVEGVFFEVLNQGRDSVGIDPCLATVVAWSEPVGVVILIDKGAVGNSSPISMPFTYDTMQGLLNRCGAAHFCFTF
jgi:hypothetical protein